MPDIPPDTLPVTRSLAQRLRAEGAVMVIRDGVATAANFGSVSGEEAVCLTRAGIAHRADLVTAELAAGAAGLAPSPEPGRAVRSGAAWMLCTPDERHVAVGSRAEIDALAAVPSALVALSVIGPRAARLVLAAGGPPAGMEVGEVAGWALGRQDAWLLREGPRQFLALVPPALARDAWDRMTVAGRSVGASHVGLEAVRRLVAARHVALA